MAKVILPKLEQICHDCYKNNDTESQRGSHCAQFVVCMLFAVCLLMLQEHLPFQLLLELTLRLLTMLKYAWLCKYYQYS